MFAFILHQFAMAYFTGYSVFGGYMLGNAFRSWRIQQGRFTPAALWGLFIGAYICIFIAAFWPALLLFFTPEPADWMNDAND